MIFYRKFFLLNILLLGASCSNENISPADTLTTIISAPVQTLNPLYATDANSQHINDLTHAGLLKISNNLLPEPYLAEEMRTINNTTLEFKLRKGCLFPNGQEIQSEDVIKSWNFYTNPKNNSAFMEQFKKIIRIEALDKYKFRIITEKTVASLPTDLYSMKIMQLSALTAEEKPTNIPGAGPYNVATFSPSAILLEKKKGGGCLPEAITPKIRIKVVRDDLSRYLKLKNGELDIVLNEINFRKVEAIEGSEKSNLGVLRSAGVGYNYIGINTANEILKDLRVRKAIALSLDIPVIIQYKSRGMASAARNLLSDNNFYANKAIPIQNRDLKTAKALLDEAGYYNGENTKKPLKLTLKTTTALVSIENARVIAAQAKEAGIEIEHKPFDWGIFYSDVKSGNTELYLLRWVGVSDPGIYSEIFHSREIGKNNRTKYRNPEMDAWIDKGQATLNPEKRKLAFDKVQEIASKDLPYIGLWHPMNVAVFRKNIKNIALHPTGSWLNFAYMRKE